MNDSIGINGFVHSKTAKLINMAIKGIAVSALSMPIMFNAYAEENEKTEKEIEVVVVKGFRNSIGKAIDIKRNSNGFVDAISAEDLGKLPDQNVAEALQRVTGVSISRSRGEGDFVSIRGLGPNFVRGTVNGRTLISSTESRDAVRSGATESSTGRETNFDLLPAEIISTLEVIKSPSAEHVEGGIGGVVNIETHRPLSLGNKATATIKGLYREFSEDIDPSVSGLISRENADGSFGWLMALSYSDRTIRDDNSDGFGYWTTGAGIDSNADGSSDIAAGIQLPFSNNPSSFTEERERITAQSTLQWRGDTSELTVDLLYSQREVENLGSLAIIGSCCLPWGFNGAVLGNGVTNPDGSIQIPDITFNDDNVQSYSFASEISTISDQQEIDDNLFSIGAEYVVDIQDWSVNYNASYAKSKGELLFERVSLQTLGTVPFNLSLTNDQINLTQGAGSIDLSNIANYRTNNADTIERLNEDEELAFSVDGELAINGSDLVSAIKIGARYRSRSKDRTDATSFNVNTDQLNAEGLGSFYNIENFLDGRTDLPFSKFIFPNVNAQQAFLQSNNTNANFAAKYSAPQSYENEEKTFAAYAQLDLDGELGDIPFKGNVGVRLVHTQQDITGFFQPFRIDNDESNNNLGKIVQLSDMVSSEVLSSEYTNILPSFNIAFDLTDELILRFAANEALTRPTFSQLAPGLTGINPTQRTAGSGNTNLVAYESTNYDLGLEWYFNEHSAITAGIFSKKIDNFIGTSTVLDNNSSGADGDGDGVTDNLGSSITRFGVGFSSISQPANQGSADITGIEIGYQQSFDSGFGYTLNVTLIESSAEFTSGVNEGNTIPFEGVSDLGYNATVYYEKDSFQGRLAYSYRSEYVLAGLSSDVFGNTLYADDYAQLDASLSYEVSEDISVFLNAVNLTDEDTKVYSDTVAKPVSLSHVGARYELGLRVNF